MTATSVTKFLGSGMCIKPVFVQLLFELLSLSAALAIGVQTNTHVLTVEEWVTISSTFLKIVRLNK